MRVAAIDIGTNTALLLVAERAASGELVSVEEEAIITRLGEGVDRTRRLSPEAIARTCAAIDRFATAIARLAVARLDVVGTSAMRDAEGGEALRAHVRTKLGVEARTISGQEEARLTFAGAVSGIAIPDGDVRVFDIGGGSTEVVHGRAPAAGRPLAIAFAESFDVGSVRLTERHVASDPPSAAELDTVRAAAAATFARLPPCPSVVPPVGIAGTMTTLAAVSLGLTPYDGSRVHGLTLPTSELARVVAKLARLPLAARRGVPGLEPKRADVIVAGGLIALAYLERAGASAVTISDRGVRWGLAETLASPVAQP